MSPVRLWLLRGKLETSYDSGDMAGKTSRVAWNGQIFVD